MFESRWLALVHDDEPTSPVVLVVNLSGEELEVPLFDARSVRLFASLQPVSL